MAGEPLRKAAATARGLDISLLPLLALALTPALYATLAAVEAARRGALLVTGPSGSGKTSVLRLVLGLLRPDAGVVRVFGVDPADPANTPGVRRRDRIPVPGGPPGPPPKRGGQHTPLPLA
jgi:ABC-type transport system involved in cytochrome bd biosynthesis fused ATPase/permease subunit